MRAYVEGQIVSCSEWTKRDGEPILRNGKQLFTGYLLVDNYPVEYISREQLDPTQGPVPVVVQLNPRTLFRESRGRYYPENCYGSMVDVVGVNR